MLFKKIKPTTPSKRHLIQLNKNHLNKKPILKTQVIGKKNSAGRNNIGRITIFHRGGGLKKRYRKVNFNRDFDSTCIICSFEYDPNRKAFIASVFDYITKKFYYILAPKNQRIGDIVKSGLKVELNLGNSLPLSDIPVGTHIHNVSTRRSKKAQISRAAGTFSVIKEKIGNKALLELSSKELRLVPLDSFATVGEVSNRLSFLTRLGKAGQSRWLNRRPIVRGVAMNPVDHPHGGGEGKKSGKSLTPWGKPVKRGKTSKSNNKLIIKKSNG